MSQEHKIEVDALDALIAEIAAKDVEADCIKASLEEKNKEINALKARVVSYLKEANREGYKAPKGTVSISEQWTVVLPKTVELKMELFNWMREQGIYDKYATVHATALKTLFLAEREAAIEAGEDPLTFTIPGMEPATMFEVLRFTKPRG